MNIAALLSVLGGFACLHASAGELLSFRQEGRETGTMRLYLDPSQLKMELNGKTGEARQTMLFSKEKSESTIIDHKRKEFMVMDKATMDKMASKMGSAMAQMKEAMQNMPPEMRKMMQEQMKAQAGPAEQAPIEVKKVGSGESVGKWKATHYTLSRGKKTVSDTWTVPPSELGVDPKNFAIMKDMSEMFSGIGKEMGSLFGDSGQAAPMQLESWKSMDGFPVKTVSHGERGAQSVILENVEKKSFSGADFAIPSGYKKKQMRGM